MCIALWPSDCHHLCWLNGTYYHRKRSLASSGHLWHLCFYGIDKGITLRMDNCIIDKNKVLLGIGTWSAKERAYTRIKQWLDERNEWRMPSAYQSLKVYARLGKESSSRKLRLVQSASESPVLLDSCRPCWPDGNLSRRVSTEVSSHRSGQSHCHHRRSNQILDSSLKCCYYCEATSTWAIY